MTSRGILLGSAAFGAVFLLERQFGSGFKDISRYNKMREMSGDPPLQSEAFKALGQYIVRTVRQSRGGNGDRGARSPNEDERRAEPAQNGGGSILDTLLKDVMRYAAIRSM